MKCRNCIRNRDGECDIFPRLVIRPDTDWKEICRYGKKERHDDTLGEKEIEKSADSGSQRARPIGKENKRSFLARRLNPF